MQDILSNMIFGILAFTLGLVLLLVPSDVYTIFVDVLLGFLGLNVIWLLIRFVRQKNRMDILMSMLSFALLVVLSNHLSIPQRLIQIFFGVYCLLCAMASLVQLVLNYMNNTDGKFWLIVFSLFYSVLGVYLIQLEENLLLLLRGFGFYLMILGARYMDDAMACINPLTKYQWKRKFRITFPAILCAFFPDWSLNAINRYLEKGKPVELVQKDRNAQYNLSVFVHVGPYGLQKVGHICFAYQGVVYSYGNYDSKSFRFSQTIGDGVFFKAPVEYYIPNAMEAEKNTIFEYGILLDDHQKQVLEEELKKLENRAYRWLCQIERAQGYDQFDMYKEDYPSRLHYRTGAKLYKLTQGKFKTYWALGDNCALFTDRILGCLGADILSIRGIISPGTYLEWLQNEYLKKNSVIVSRKLHTLNN